MAPPDRKESSAKFRTSLVSLSLTWLSQWVLWLIFANNDGFREMLAGAAAATLATWSIVMFVRRTGDCFHIRFRYAAQAVHLPAALVRDTATVFAVIARRVMGAPIRGEIAAASYELREPGPEQRGCRALAITFLTLTPNTLVFGFVPRRRTFFFHRLAPEPLPHFLRVFGIGSRGAA